MSRSSDSGQVEPVAALVAVFAVCAGLTVYVGVLDDTVPFESERDLQDTAADALVEDLSSFGVVEPPIEAAVHRTTPNGHRMNATLRSEGQTWSGGPAPPGKRERVDRPVSVRVEPALVRPGRIEVYVWTAA